MKTACNQRNESGGMILFTSLGVFTVITVILGGYFWMIQWHNSTVARSQSWNEAMVVAEAGVEEAMAHLNTDLGTNVLWGPNGWAGPDGAGLYRPNDVRTLTNGSSYSVVIDMSGLVPVVYSTGYTTVPIKSQTLARVVRANTGISYLFNNAMVALRDIDFKGNNIAVDSYDSSDPNHSTNGRYDPTKRKDGGDVASTDGLIGVGNADIKGHLLTGPANTNYSIGPNGSVGSTNWAGPGVEDGWYRSDFNMDVKDATLPQNFNPIEATDVGPGGTTTYVLTSGDWELDKLTLKTGDMLTVASNQTARIYIEGDIKMSGTSQILLQSGASLQMYVGTDDPSTATSVDLTDVNVAPDASASAFQYYGLPSNTSIKWTSDAEYVGTVYAPQARFELKGGADPAFPSDYQGACVVKSVWMNGHFKFHFDEQLKDGGPVGGFVVASWRELDPAP